MVSGLPGASLDNVQRLAEEVWSTEAENVTTQHQQMEEKIVEDLQNSLMSVIHFHVQVNSLSKNMEIGWLNDSLSMVLFVFLLFVLYLYKVNMHFTFASSKHLKG